MFQLGLKLDVKSMKSLNWSVWIIFVVFFGFRGLIGWDWHSYYPFFKSIKPIFEFNFNTETPYDKGFVIYATIIKACTKEYNLFILISTIIDGVLLHFFFKRYLPMYLYTFGFVVFIVMEGLIMEVNLMRNIKGLLLFLLSIQYIEKRNLTKYFLLNLLGLSFHWSSIVFFPLYFFIHKKIELKVVIYIFVIGNIIYLSQIEYVKPLIKSISTVFGGITKEKSDFYLNSAMFNNQYGITLGYLERFATSLLIMLYYNKLIDKSKTNIIFINSFIIFFILYFYFSEISIVVTRLGTLFIFSYWILWPQIIDTTTSISKYIIVSILCIYLNIRVSKMTNNVLFKYDNIIFENSQSFQQREKVFNQNASKLQKKKQ